MPPRLSLELPAGDPHGVTRARHAVGELAVALGVGEDIRERIALAVTEACSNCVLHAYDGSAGDCTYRLDAYFEDGEFVVVVQDSGAGIAGDGDTREASATSGLGYGLVLIRKLSSSAQVASVLDRGTRVEMRFDVS